jgi:hypothetical protein
MVRPPPFSAYSWFFFLEFDAFLMQTGEGDEKAGGSLKRLDARLLPRFAVGCLFQAGADSQGAHRPPSTQMEETSLAYHIQVGCGVRFTDIQIYIRGSFEDSNWNAM